MVFSLDKGTTDMATTAIGVGVGFTAWMYTATRNVDRGQPIFSAQRFSDALGNILGPNLAQQITGKSTGSVQKFNLMGWANKVTFIGIALKVVNGMTKKWTEKYFDSIPDFVDAAANGLIAGGAIGGIFDPPGMTQTSMGWQAIGNTPNPRADGASRVAVLI